MVAFHVDVIGSSEPLDVVGELAEGSVAEWATSNPAIPSRESAAELRSVALMALGTLAGMGLTLASFAIPQLSSTGWQALGPLLGIAVTVFSLFGELPTWIAWMQRLGVWVFPGVVVGTLILLVPLLPDSRWAPSPRVWAAYFSIVLVSIVFEYSSLPKRLYTWCSGLPVQPAVLVPVYVLVAGLLGNILDGVSIIAISVVIFLHLLPRQWATRASFALLFGGLISNLVTVAAEPTNIKFQDVLFPVLDHVTPSYWLTNWPISVFGIILPAAWLFAIMRRAKVQWHRHPHQAETHVPFERHELWELPLSILALSALAAGIILHSYTEFTAGDPSHPAPPGLWKFLLPAGGVAALYLLLTWKRLSQHGKLRIQVDLWKMHWRHDRKAPPSLRHILFELPVWFKLMVIFSLLWFLANGLTASINVFAAFFTWPEPIQYASMLLLSLFSSVTDNVALAAMQGSLILNHPLAVWQIRLVFVVLAWAGGFTPFGCLQSLALNSRLLLSTRRWFGETLVWGGLSLIGGLVGLLYIAILYPGAFGNLP